MVSNDSVTEQLLRRARSNETSAVDELLDLHRKRLRKMVAVRIDPRLTARVDPSDVVQETLLEASRRLSEYLGQSRRMPFYPWLRGIAMNRLVDIHRQHVRAKKRSVKREGPRNLALPDKSAVELAKRLMAPGTSPSGQMEKKENRERVKRALARLNSDAREVLVLQYLEELSSGEISAIKGISERAVRQRHADALEQLGALLNEPNME